MADNSKIEWCDATWNVIVGCSVLSPGCTNRYAMRLAGTRLKHHPSRAGLTVESKAGPVWTGEARLDEKALTQPLHWRRPRKIFVCAHSDLFHEATPDEWIDRVFAVMTLCPQHTFQVLTKRPERMRTYIASRTTGWQETLANAFAPGTLPITKNDIERAFGLAQKFSYDPPTPTWPLPNVWLGVTAEDQTRADERIPVLLATPAAKRFVSVEPMLGAVDLRRLSCADPAEVAQYERGEIDGVCGYYVDALSGDAWDDANGGLNAEVWGDDAEHPPRLDWVICGGESGPGARPMAVEWAKDIRNQCAAAGTAFFMKQMSGKTGAERAAIPADLLVREFPDAR